MLGGVRVFATIEGLAIPKHLPQKRQNPGLIACVAVRCHAMPIRATLSSTQPDERVPTHRLLALKQTRGLSPLPGSFYGHGVAAEKYSVELR